MLLKGRILLRYIVGRTILTFLFRSSLALKPGRSSFIESEQYHRAFFLSFSFVALLTFLAACSTTPAFHLLTKPVLWPGISFLPASTRLFLQPPGVLQAPSGLPTVTPSPLNEVNVAINEVVSVGDLYQETLVILNQGTPASLKDWKLEGSPLGIFIFPDIVLVSGGSIRVHTAAGENTSSDLYLNQGESAWPPDTTVILSNANNTEISRFTVPAPPDPFLIPPPPVENEGPLGGTIPKIPGVYLVPSRQTKAGLAAFLRTTPEQLTWVNPRLPDPINPGTLVVIPPIYRVGPGENLSDVIKKTTLPEEVLLSANPHLSSQEALTDGTFLVVPPLYIVPSDTPVSEAAENLNLNGETLLSANPELTDQDTIQAGTVLIVPPEALNPEAFPARK